MATVFRPIQTKPLPPSAEVLTRKGERYAKWKDTRGRTRTAKVTTTKNGDRIVLESPYYRVRYRDAKGVLQDVSTGCRDAVAAQSMANELVRRAELIKAGVMTTAQDAAADHEKVALTKHIEVYTEHLTATGVTDGHRKATKTYLHRLTEACGWGHLSDLKRDSLEKWLAMRVREKMSARSRNGHLKAAVAFSNWCIDTNRLSANPFARIRKADEDADRRRQRRALTEEELQRLLAVARQRPLLDRLTISRGERKGKPEAKLSEDSRRHLDWVGRERALIYKTLVLTGLRKKELASTTVGRVVLDGPTPCIILEAKDEKNREGSDIPLRDDLVTDIRQWLADKLKALQEDARHKGQPIPMKLPAIEPLFDVPDGLLRILDRDLVKAGIARLNEDGTIDKRDERGRTVDVHALRTTFGTHLSRGGVSLRVAQAAMRHSDPSLTANVYTDPKLLDVRQALDVLPQLPIDEINPQNAKTSSNS